MTVHHYRNGERGDVPINSETGSTAHAEQTRPTAYRVMAHQIESTGNIVSGLGEHGLANQLWALAGRLRERDNSDPGDNDTVL